MYVFMVKRCYAIHPANLVDDSPYTNRLSAKLLDSGPPSVICTCESGNANESLQSFSLKLVLMHPV